MEEGAEVIRKACLEKEAGAQTWDHGVPQLQAPAFLLPSCLRGPSFWDAEIRQGPSSSRMGSNTGAGEYLG